MMYETQMEPGFVFWCIVALLLLAGAWTVLHLIWEWMKGDDDR